jgi:rhodanese-related sulfurtransferase
MLRGSQLRTVKPSFFAFTIGLAMAATITALSTTVGQAESAGAAKVSAATLQEPNQKTPEISTEELRRILAEGSAPVLDARTYREFAIGHIPGARNVAAKPGVPNSQYVSDVAEIGRLLNNDKTGLVVLYCNGPFCGKSKRLSAELIASGYTNVRRYQLGAPVWRALGGVMQIETDGLLYVLGKDQTAVLIDARDSEAFRAQTIPGARSVPAGKPGEVNTAKDDGRLPMEDHNTRIIVFGRDGAEARAVAEAIAHEAFHNVAFYDGSLVQEVAVR